MLQLLGDYWRKAFIARIEQLACIWHFAQQDRNTANFQNQLAAYAKAALLAHLQRSGNFLLCRRVKRTLRSVSLSVTLSSRISSSIVARYRAISVNLPVAAGGRNAAWKSDL
jgi:hypothetical protein